MAALITQEEAAAQLRLELVGMNEAEAADLAMRSEQASDIVTNYLKRDSDAPPVRAYPLSRIEQRAVRGEPRLAQVPGTRADFPAWTPETVPPTVKAGILLVLTALYDDRTTEGPYLSDAVTALLWRWRDPALA